MTDWSASAKCWHLLHLSAWLEQLLLIAGRATTGCAAPSPTSPRFYGCERGLSIALLSLVLPTSGASQQAVPVVEVPLADAAVSVEFSDIGAVRELPGEWVLVTDRRERRLIVVNFALDSARAIGAQGKGPDEYGAVAQLIPLAADSTLLPDLPNRRWHLLVGPQIVATVPSDDPAVRATAGSILGAGTC